MLNEFIFYCYSMTLMRTRLAVRVDVLEVEGGGEVARVPYLHTTRVVDLDNITIVVIVIGFRIRIPQGLGIQHQGRGSGYHQGCRSTITGADPDTPL